MTDPGNDGRLKVGIALRNKAAWVHQRLTQAAALATPMGEETLTETLLLDLRLELGAHLVVDTFTKHVESRVTGADWEWWFCDSVGQTVFGMRVQAKKLKTTNAGVPYYDLGYKPKKSAKRQVDRLVTSAKQNGLPAVYALYNGPQLDMGMFSWPCCTEPASPSVFGVSMLSGDAALALADNGATTLSDVGPLSLPWSCCALCPTMLALGQHPSWPDDPVPDDFGPLVLYAADMATALLVRDAELTGTRAWQRAREARGGLRRWSDAPPYLREIVETMGQHRTGDPFELEEGRVDLPSDLGGVALWIAQPPR